MSLLVCCNYCLALHKFISFRLMAASSLRFRSSIRQWACSTARAQVNGTPTNADDFSLFSFGEPNGGRMGSEVMSGPSSIMQRSHTHETFPSDQHDLTCSCSAFMCTHRGRSGDERRCLAIWKKKGAGLAAWTARNHFIGASSSTREHGMSDYSVSEKKKEESLRGATLTRPFSCQQI